jgi:hypothetical protein
LYDVHLAADQFRENPAMSKPYAVTLAGLDFTAIAEDEFNDWYDLEHIPQRRLPGVLNAERWIAVDNPRVSITTYDMESVDVRETPAYKNIVDTPWSRRMHTKTKRVCFFVAEQTLPGRLAAPEGAGSLLMVGITVPDEADAEFNAWCNEEHIPQLAAVKGCLTARRFKVTQGVQRYLNLFHLASPEVQESAGWKAAIDTPWSTKMRGLMTDRLRIVTRRYQRG